MMDVPEISKNVNISYYEQQMSITFRNHNPLHKFQSSCPSQQAGMASPSIFSSQFSVQLNKGTDRNEFKLIQQIYHIQEFVYQYFHIIPITIT